MPDPERPSCETCPYWEPRDDDYRLLPIGHPDREDGDGECHRHAPRGEVVPCGSGVFVEPGRYMYAWPRTDAVDGCGDHPGFAAYAKAVMREAKHDA